MSSLVGLPVKVVWSEDAPELAGPHWYYLQGWFLPDKYVEWTMTKQELAATDDELIQRFVLPIKASIKSSQEAA